MDDRYNFPSIIAIKLLIRKKNKFFLIKEPKTNEWKPGCFTLPGGKLLLHESIIDGINRKIKTEVGFKIKIIGLIKIIDMLVINRNVYHFIFLADYTGGEIDKSKIEAQDYKWFSSKEISNISKNKFAEYYIDEIIAGIKNNKLNHLSLEDIKIQDFKKPKLDKWLKI